MRVTLIAPDGERATARAEVGRDEFRALLPPLSLLQVAALTPPGVEVRVQDEAVHELDLDSPYDLAGITGATSAAPRAYQLADSLRARGVPVVMGGMHASALPEEALQHCDAVVVGEAEGQWERVVQEAQAGRLQRIYRAADFPDMRRAPVPRRELIDRRDYLLPDTVQATRGCAHSCSFCSVTPFFGRRLRSREAEAVAQEVGSLPGEYVIFVDDNIMTRPAYARQLFSALVGAGKKWVGQASTAVLEDAQLLRLAARAGCQLIFVGLESLSTAALSQVNKGFNAAARFRDLVRRLHDADIGVIGAFMFGIDGDDEDVFERTAQFADRARIDVPQYSILTPLPGTPLYAKLEAEGRIFDRDWSHYNGNHAVFQPSHMTPDRLLEGFRAALRHSYSRLSIARRLFGCSPRLPRMAAINVEFRHRAIPYVNRTRKAA